MKAQRSSVVFGSRFYLLVHPFVNTVAINVAVCPFLFLRVLLDNVFSAALLL